MVIPAHIPVYLKNHLEQVVAAMLSVLAIVAVLGVVLDRTSGPVPEPQTAQSVNSEPRGTPDATRAAGSGSTSDARPATDADKRRLLPFLFFRYVERPILFPSAN